MLYTAFLVLLAVPPQSTFPTGGFVSHKPAVVNVSSGLPAGWHSHQCPNCKTIWSHGAGSFGNRAAHTCPKCGVVQFKRTTAPQSSIQSNTQPKTSVFSVVPPQSMVPLSQSRSIFESISVPNGLFNSKSNCPNGRCPNR